MEGKIQNPTRLRKLNIALVAVIFGLALFWAAFAMAVWLAV